MLTALKLQPPSPSPVAIPRRNQALLAATPIRAKDRVVVVGQGAFDLLLDLAQDGCTSAVAVRSPSHCRSAASVADVIWFTGLETIGPDIEIAISHLETPRTVAIELTRDSAKVGLAAILELLRAKGLADQSVGKAGGRTLVVASRPAWLRRVI